MLGNIGNLFVKCMCQVTKAICTICWGYRNTMLCIGRGLSQFCETSAKVINWVTDPLAGSVNFCEQFVVRGREF